MTNEIWKPLHTENREIRLLTVEPSEDIDAQPRCSIDSFSLDIFSPGAPLWYCAVSYAWGDHTRRTPIELQGQQVLVTTSLEACLRHVRSKKRPLLIWADGLCIHQEDEQEKTHQVPLMKDIYSSARLVYVWLGESTPSTDRALGIIEGLIDRDNPPGEVSQLVQLCRPDSEETINADDLRDIIAFLERPWWHRLWVQQEYILARRVEYLCGEFYIDGLDVLRLGVMSSLGVINLTNKETTDQFGEDVLNEFSISLDTFSRIRALFDYQDPESADSAADNFIWTLATARFFRSSNALDCIYGLLGLAPKAIAIEITPQYDVSLQTVFRRTATTLLRHCDTLLLLSLLPDQKRPEPGVPSWVPDWSGLGSDHCAKWCWSNRLARLGERRRFSAGANHAMVLEFYKETTLRLSGLQVDRVAEVSTEIWRESGNNRSLVEWQKFCVRSRRERYVAGGSWEHAFWQTLVNDRQHGDLCTRSPGKCLQNCEHPNETRKRYRRWAKEMQEPGPFSDEDVTFFNMAVKFGCAARRFFVTQRGYIGVGPATLACGDAIYILAGGHHPYALRPSQATRQAELSSWGHTGNPRDSGSEICLAAHPDSTPGPSFELIGDCYVHGVMYGEAITGKRQKYHSVKDLMRRLVFGGQGPDSRLAPGEFNDIYIV